MLNLYRKTCFTPNRLVFQEVENPELTESGRETEPSVNFTAEKAELYRDILLKQYKDERQSIGFQIEDLYRDDTVDLRNQLRLAPIEKLKTESYSMYIPDDKTYLGHVLKNFAKKCGSRNTEGDMYVMLGNLAQRMDVDGIKKGQLVEISNNTITVYADKDKQTKVVETVLFASDTLQEGEEVVEEVEEDSNGREMERTNENTYKIYKNGIDINLIAPSDCRHIKVTDSDGYIQLYVRIGDRFYCSNPDEDSPRNTFFARKGMVIEVMPSLAETKDISTLVPIESVAQDAYKEISRDEPLVENEIVGRRVILRINAMRALQSATKDMVGINVKLLVNESFRSEDDQKRLKKKDPLKAEMPGLSTHQTGGAIDVSLASYDEKIEKLDPAAREQAVAILANYGFHQVYESEDWHFEFNPDKRDGGRAYDAYNIITEVTGISDADDFNTIKEMVRGYASSDVEAIYLANMIQKSIDKCSDFPITPETIALLVSTFHRESGFRQYPEINEKQIEKMEKYVEMILRPDAVDALLQEFIDKTLADTKMNKHSGMAKRVIKWCLENTNLDEEILDEVRVTYADWKKSLPMGKPQTEYDIFKFETNLRDKLVDRITKKIVEGSRIGFGGVESKPLEDEYVRGITSSLVDYLIDKMGIKPSSVGIGQVNVHKAKLLIEENIRDNPSSTSFPPDMMAEYKSTGELSVNTVENYLYTIEGGITASTLYVRNLLNNYDACYGSHNCNQEARIDITNKLPYIIADYNAGEFSSRNAFFQNALLEIAELTGSEIEIPEEFVDGDLGKRTVDYLQKLLAHLNKPEVKGNLLKRGINIDSYELLFQPEYVEKIFLEQKTGYSKELEKLAIYQSIIDLHEVLYVGEGLKVSDLKLMIPEIKTEITTTSNYVGGTLLRVMSKTDHRLFEEVSREQKKIGKKEKLQSQDYLTAWGRAGGFAEKYRESEIKEVILEGTQFKENKDGNYEISGDAIVSSGKDLYRVSGESTILIRKNDGRWRLARYNDKKEGYYFGNKDGKEKVMLMNKNKYEIKVPSNEEVKEYENRAAFSATKEYATYSIGGKRISASPRDFYNYMGDRKIKADYIEVKTHNPLMVRESENIDDWKPAKWDPIMEKYYYMDTYREVKFLNEHDYLIRLASKERLEQQLKPDTFIETRYGIQIYGEFITKTGRDFHEAFVYERISVNGKEALWNASKKNYFFVDTGNPMRLTGGKYVIEDLDYMTKLSAKIDNDAAKAKAEIGKYIENGKLELKTGQYFVFVNKNSAKQYIFLGVYNGDGNFDIVKYDKISTGRSKTATLKGVHKISRINAVREWGKSYGSERDEYDYRAFDISRTPGLGIALHPTNRPDLLGQTASSGCVRISFTFSRTLEEYATTGTPVIISAI